MDESQYLKKYPRTKRQCTICLKNYSYVFRERKRTGKTCSGECAKKRADYTKKIFHKRWYKNKRELAKRHVFLDYFIDNLYQLGLKELESLYIQLQTHLVNKHVNTIRER
jgi:hypothetical protein